MQSLLTEAFLKFLSVFGYSVTPDASGSVEEHAKNLLELLPKKFNNVIVIGVLCALIPFIARIANAHLSKYVDDLDGNGRISVEEIVNMLSNLKK